MASKCTDEIILNNSVIACKEVLMSATVCRDEHEVPGWEGKRDIDEKSPSEKQISLGEVEENGNGESSEKEKNSVNNSSDLYNRDGGFSNPCDGTIREENTSNYELIKSSDVLLHLECESNFSSSPDDDKNDIDKELKCDEIIHSDEKSDLETEEVRGSSKCNPEANDDESHVTGPEKCSETAESNEAGLIMTDSISQETPQSNTSEVSSPNEENVVNRTPQNTSNNLNELKSYTEREEVTEVVSLATKDPMSTDPSQGDKENSKVHTDQSNTILVDLKQLVEIASGTRKVEISTKEPMVVILTGNSILSGQGPTKTANPDSGDVNKAVSSSYEIPQNHPNVSSSNEQKCQNKNKRESSSHLESKVSPKLRRSTRSATVTNLKLRHSPRILKEQKNYAEVDDDDSDLEVVTEVDPLATEVDPLSTEPVQRYKENIKACTARKNAILVSEPKRSADIATGSKGIKTGQKEPTFIFIDAKSILSGQGPIPLTQENPICSPLVITTLKAPVTLSPSSSSPSTSGYRLKPIAPKRHVNSPHPSNLHPFAKAVVRTRPPAPPPLLTTLTDDMDVVEQPSFIVPYIFEQPPVKSLKEYLKQFEKELEVDKILSAGFNNSPVKQEEKSEESIGKRGEDDNDDKANRDNDSKDYKDNEVLKRKDEMYCSSDAEEKENNSARSVASVWKENTDKDEHIVNGKNSEMIIDGPYGENMCKETPKFGISSPRNATRSGNDDNKDSIKCEGIPLEEIKNPENFSNAKYGPVKEKSKNKHEGSNKTTSSFDSPLGRFFMQIGENLVQEYVQTDMLRSEKRKRDREGNGGSASTQKAIDSLVKNLEISKEVNEPFHLEQRKCEYCSFKTESSLVMANHLETPHVHNNIFKCNFCPLEAGSAHSILLHMEAEHGVRGRLELAAVHQCPICPFEDRKKASLTRHVFSCTKKHNPDRNQEPPSDWELPAKYPSKSRSQSTAMGSEAKATKRFRPLLPATVRHPATGSVNTDRGRPLTHGHFLQRDFKTLVRPIALKKGCWTGASEQGKGK